MLFNMYVIISVAVVVVVVVVCLFVCLFVCFFASFMVSFRFVYFILFCICCFFLFRCFVSVVLFGFTSCLCLFVVCYRFVLFCIGW
jgi:hypothetical protein